MMLNFFRRAAFFGLICVVVFGACSDTGEPATDAAPATDAGPDSTMVPATVKVTSGKTTLVITTAPLSLSLQHDGKELTRGAGSSATDPLAALALGVTEPFKDNRYYDPAKPPDTVKWAAATRAVKVDHSKSDTTLLTLDNGMLLTVKPAAASGAIQLYIAAAPPDVKGSGPQVVLSRICSGVQPREVFFGFGELFDRVSSRNVVRPMQLLVDTTMDSALNEIHSPVPVAISPRGWGMMVRDFHAGAFDVAKTRNDRICATFHTHKLDLYLMTAADPLALVERTVSLTAKPALPPDWAFAPQQWRNVLKSQAELMTDASDMRKHKIPGSVVWIDNPWQTGYNTFEFDTKQFPDAKGTIAKLHAMGYRVLLWSTPYINTDQKAAFAHAEKMGYLVKDPVGNALSYKWGNGIGSLVDFTAPGATAYWQTQIKKVTALGIDGFKLDYGEEAVVALATALSFFRFHGGKTAATLHRQYAGLYHRTYLDTLPQGQGFLITRAGALGEQKYNTCIWPGDLDATFATHAQGRVGGLPAAISAGLSLSVSGYPFFGSDIGGYRKGLPTTELLLRWAEYAALGTIMQLGGGGKNHNPWDTTLYGSEALAHYRKYARLHTDLFPTIYSYAVQAAATGRPVTRPLGMAYPADPETWTRDFQFMLGEFLLVAPVIVAKAKTRKVYLPAGRWVHHWTRVSYRGPRLVEVAAPLGQVPLFHAEGAIVARLATAVDTLAPATDSGVVSYQDHNKELLLELLPSPGTSAKTTRLKLFDGATFQLSAGAAGVLLELEPGKQFSDIHLQLDWNLHPASQPPKGATLAGKVLAQAATVAALASCKSGCWYYDTPLRTLHLRLSAPAGKLLISR